MRRDSDLSDAFLSPEAYRATQAVEFIAEHLRNEDEYVQVRIKTNVVVAVVVAVVVEGVVVVIIVAAAVIVVIVVTVVGGGDGGACAVLPLLFGGCGVVAVFTIVF